MKLCVIPARGGSKRIPRKNIKPFLGRPIIQWSIEAAVQSGCFDKIIVSTDDDEIAEVAQKNGAEVPFMRPHELANDFAETIPVIAHAIRWFACNNTLIDAACCIYPTAPLIKKEDLIFGMNALQEKNANYAFAAVKFNYPIQRAFRINKRGRIELIDESAINARSQDLEESWHDAGQFYWGKRDSWIEELPIFGPESIPIPIPSIRAQDIDTVDDWDNAEFKFKFLREKNLC